MFCPQCRVSWQAEGKDGAVRVDKPKRNPAKLSEWGRPLICPTCLVPLAADRIQGEFPSVAHASSAKEGSMTIKDVLREASRDDSGSGEVGLDDKKPEPKRRFLGIDRGSKGAFAQLFLSAKPSPLGLLQRMAVITFALCIVSIVVISFRAARVGMSRPKQNVGAVHAGSRPPVLSADEQAVLRLMPVTVGSWTRVESNSDIWNNGKVAGSNVKAYASTYRFGSSRVQMWAVKTPGLTSIAQNLAYVSMPRTIHTDSGVTTSSPLVSNVGFKHVVFDYMSERPDHFWIVGNQPYSPTMAHTVSWFQKPYVITIEANTQDDRDSFFSSMLSPIN